MRLFRTTVANCCFLLAAAATVVLVIRPADAQLTVQGVSQEPETYVVDSKGTTLFRNGVPVCRVNCGPPAASSFPPALTPTRLSTPPAMAERSLSADRYPLRPEELEARTGAPLPEPARPPTTAPTVTQSTATTPLSVKTSPQTATSAIAAPAKKNGGLTKEQKAIILNGGAAIAITGYGIGFWDYFQTAPKADGEGWFGRTTSHGGADKLGHFWATYAVSHLFSYVYRWWDFDAERANTMGALSSLGIQTLMEVGDAFSGDFGFSYEDALMNAAGAGAAYVLGKYPSLARKIDFRFEYTPTSFNDLTDDVLTNYDNQRYLVALKLDGFDVFHDSYLSYLELHAGYYTRGYEEFDPGDPDNRRRHLYFGVGFNVSKLVQKFVDIAVFDYVQVPYTSIGIRKGLD